MSVSPPAQSRWFAPHQGCLYCWAAAFPGHCAADTDSSSSLTCSCCSFNIFALWHFHRWVLSFNFLFSSSLPLLFVLFWFEKCLNFVLLLNSTDRRFLMFYLLGEGARQVLVNFDRSFLSVFVSLFCAISCIGASAGQYFVLLLIFVLLSFFVFISWTFTSCSWRITSVRTFFLFFYFESTVMFQRCGAIYIFSFIKKFLFF